MKTRRILAAAAALAVGLAVSGCSSGKFVSPKRLFDSSGSQAAAQSVKDPSARSELALARLNERRGQPDQAERLYQRLLEKDPKNPAPYHRLAVMRASQGRFQEANDYFEQALRLAPSDPAVLSDAGYCYYLQHRLDEAEEVLRRALEFKPNDPGICNNLAVLLGEQGRDQECLAMFRRTGGEAQAYANMAFIYAQRGELELAKASYSRALTLDQRLKPAAEALVQIAQYERLAAPAPSSEPVPRAVGSVVASGSEDDGALGDAMVTDSAQPVSFDQASRATGPEAFFPAPDTGVSRREVDIASGLGDILSRPKN